MTRLECGHCGRLAPVHPVHGVVCTCLAPPDIDEVAVERALRGERVSLNADERAEIVRRIRRANLGTSRLAAVLRCSGARAAQLLRETT